MWVLLALLTAAGTAVRDAASKHATREVDPIVVGCAIAAIPAIVIGALLLGRGVVVQGAGLPAALTPGPGFVTALAVSGGINAVTTPLIVWALKRSDLSLVAPLTSLTPLFMIPTAAIVLDEAPSVAGAVGVAVIVVGAYLLNVSDRDAGLLAPFAALARDPGARAMLLVAALYSVSGTYDKVGTQASTPLVWVAAVQGAVALLLAPLALRRWERSRARTRSATADLAGKDPAGKNAAGAKRIGADAEEPDAPSIARWSPAPAAALGVAGAAMTILAVAQMTALTLTLAAYVIAVKRTSTLFSVLLGHSLFREEGIRDRLLGATVMLAGFVLVTLG